MEQINAVYDSKALQASTLCARGALQLAESNAAEAVRSIKQSWRLWQDADLPYEAARARALDARLNVPRGPRATPPT